jgi:hypothetical protein
MSMVDKYLGEMPNPFATTALGMAQVWTLRGQLMSPSTSVIFKPASSSALIAAILCSARGVNCGVLPKGLSPTPAITASM